MRGRNSVGKALCVGLLSVGLICCGCGPASAQLAVDRLWVDFQSGAADRTDVTLRNESSDVYYITVSPVEVQNAGLPNETRVTEADPDKLGLLVTPNRVVMQPGDTRSIRIVSLNQGLKTDRVYRVTITPQVGDIVDNNAAAPDHAMSVKLLAAYELLVTVRPDGSKSKVDVKRVADGITLTNLGNTNVLYFDGEDCPANSDAAVGAKCIKVGSKRLYVGNAWHVKLAKPDDVLRIKTSVDPDTDPSLVNY